MPALQGSGAVLASLLLLVLPCSVEAWQHGLHKLVVTSSSFTDCYVVHVTSVNASLVAPRDLAALACSLSPWRRGAPPSVAANESGGGCAWEVALKEDSEEGCVEAVAGWLQELLQWSATVNALPYVAIPVGLKTGEAGQQQTEVYFVPRSQASLRADSRTFCRWNGIITEGVGGSEQEEEEEDQCALQLEAAARAVYHSRRAYLPQEPPAVLCPRHQPVVPPGGGPCRGGPDCPLLVAFWHVAALDEGGGGVWRAIVQEQLATMQEAGLLAALHWVSLHVAGPGKRQVEELVAPFPSIHVHPGNASLREYEFSTLSALQQHCAAHPSSWVVYFHNKGASRTQPPQQRAVSGWRRYLEEFVLRRYRSCLAVLQAGYDTCGVQWADDWAIYGGNFWWARCQYINTLPDVRSLPLWVRHMSESWVGLGQGFCPVSCHYAAKRFLYHDELGPQDYQGVTTGCDALLHSGGSGQASAYHRLHVKAERLTAFADGSASPPLVWGDGPRDPSTSAVGEGDECGVANTGSRLYAQEAVGVS